MVYARLESIIVKITGKAFDNPNPTIFKRYASVFEELIGDGYKLAIVVGGGGVARKYISLARELGVDSNYWLDTIGIDASRLNALVLVATLQPHAYPCVIEDLDTLVKTLMVYRIAVLGGLLPGQSTAAVALEVAEAIGSKKVYYMGAVDHVYTRDPRRHPSAKPLKEVFVDDLERMIEGESLPGEYQLLDRQSIEIMKRSKITIYLTHYTKPENIKEFLKGRNPGTIIKP